MTSKTSFFAAALVATALAVRAEEAPKRSASMTEDQKISYFIGHQIGQSVKNQGINLDMGPFSEGMHDGMAGNNDKFTEQEFRGISESIQAKVKKHFEEMNAKRKADGIAFLKANAKKPGVKTTKSGLQYREDRPGQGKPPKESDRVKVHYRGTLIDGTEFDSSYKRNTPAEFPLSNVIRGWTEGLQLMAPGSKYTLYIPSDMAYGEQGQSGIPPNSVLIFEVELLEILK